VSDRENSARLGKKKLNLKKKERGQGKTTQQEIMNALKYKIQRTIMPTTSNPGWL